MKEKLENVIADSTNFLLREESDNVILFNCSTSALFIQGRLVLGEQKLRLRISETNALEQEEVKTFGSVGEFVSYIQDLDSFESCHRAGSKANYDDFIRQYRRRRGASALRWVDLDSVSISLDK